MKTQDVILTSYFTKWLLWVANCSFVQLVYHGDTRSTYVIQTSLLIAWKCSTKWPSLCCLLLYLFATTFVWGYQNWNQKEVHYVQEYQGKKYKKIQL